MNLDPMVAALCSVHAEKIPARLISKIQKYRADRKQLTKCALSALEILEARKLDRQTEREAQREERRQQTKENGTKIEDVKREVCEFYKISHTHLISNRRLKNLCHARFVSYYLCRELTTASFPLIAKLHGGRDHTTVLHGAKTLDGRLPFNSELRKEVGELLVILTGEEVSPEFSGVTP